MRDPEKKLNPSLAPEYASVRKSTRSPLRNNHQDDGIDNTQEAYDNNSMFHDG